MNMDWVGIGFIVLIGLWIVCWLLGSMTGFTNTDTDRDMFDNGG